MMNQACWCLLACLVGGSALAQDAKMSLRTMQLGGDEMPETWVQVPDSKEPAKLPWLTTQPTEPIQIVHDGSLKLLRRSTNPEGKEVFEIINTIKLPSSAKEVLLLAWNSNGDAKYVAIEDSFLNAKFNDWLAINTSANTVAVLVGDKDKPVRVNPGKSVIFNPSIQEGKGVKMIAQADRKGEVRTFLSSYWPAFEKQRTIIIFYDDGERMRARRIGDRFLVKKKEGE